MTGRPGLQALRCTALIAALSGCVRPEPLAPDGERKSRLATMLISAGQDPKSALRFEVANGDEQYVTLTTDVDMLVTTRFAGGLPLSEPRTLLRLEQTRRVTVTDVAASGAISFEVSIAKAELIPSEDGIALDDPHMEERVLQLAGISASFVMSSRGIPESWSNELNEGIDPIQQQALEGMEDYLPFVAIPFPEVPIGVGAKWSVTRTIKSQGVEMTYAAVYELTKFENGTGTVKTYVDRTARPHYFKKEGRAGSRLNRMTTTTRGTHDFSLTKILPRTASLASVTEIHMVIEFPTSNMAVILLVEATQKTTETTAPVKTDPTNSITPDRTQF